MKVFTACFVILLCASPAVSAQPSCNFSLDIQNGDQSLPKGIKVLTIVLDVQSQKANHVSNQINKMDWVLGDDIMQTEYVYRFRSVQLPIDAKRTFLIANRRIESLESRDMAQVRKQVCTLVKRTGSRIHGWYVTVDGEPFGGSFYPKEFR